MINKKVLSLPVIARVLAGHCQKQSVGDVSDQNRMSFIIHLRSYEMINPNILCIFVSLLERQSRLNLMHRYHQSLRQCFQLFLSHLRYTRRSNTARQVDSRSTGFDIFKSSTKLPATTHFLLVAGWNSDTNGIPTQRRVGTRTQVRCFTDVNSLHNQE